MRVVYVISGLGFGGAERQTILAAKELVRRRHAVLIYALTAETPRAGELAGSGVELVVDAKRSRLDWRVIGRLRRLARDWRADLLHGVLYDGNLYARLAGAGTSVAVLNSERSDNYDLGRWRTGAYRATHFLADGLVANSHAGAAFAQRLHRLPAQRVHTVWNGIDLAEIDARLKVAGRPAHDVWPGENLRRVCVVGAIKPAKDHLLALRVARGLVDQDPNWRFIFAGAELSDAGDDHKSAVLAEWERLGLQDCVRFVGQRRDVPELMASCDALLVTSVHEGFPNVVLEAMSCGVPVASTDYSDVRRILPEPWQVVASRRADQLADALRRCVAEHDRIAAAQRAWVERFATLKANVEATEAIYGRYLRPPTALRKELA
jgi:glycosyltransferase involved in cell wall biosynthesis